MIYFFNYDLYRRRKGGPCALSLMAMGDTGAAKCRFKSMHKQSCTTDFQPSSFSLFKIKS